MKKQLLMILVFAAFTVPSLAHATFVLETGLSNGATPGTQLFLDSASNKTVLTGHVGSQTGPVVDIKANTAVNAASGFATIDPVIHNTLKSLVFTNGASNTEKYGDFDFRGQLASTGTITIKAIDQLGTAFTFDITNLVAHANLSRMGIVSNDGEWLQSVEISTTTFFDQVKQIEFSLQETPTTPVPEPGTMMLLGAGFLGLAIYGKRRRNA